MANHNIAAAIALLAAGDLCGQAPQPIAEWGPGLVARPELLITTTGYVPIPSDLDGDGDIDLVCGSSWDGSATMTILRNDGRGVFSIEWVPPRPTMSMRATGWALGDIDGDGDGDVVFSGQWLGGSLGGADRPYVFINTGGGTFSIDWTRFPQSQSIRAFPAIVDIDLDGDLDVVFGGETMLAIPSSVEIWLNDGRGYFTDATVGRVPAGIGTHESLTAGDLDGDGAVDLVLGRGNWGSSNPIPKRVLWNDGTGHFTVQYLPPSWQSAIRSILFDVDRDGDLDLFFKGGQGYLFINEGNRTFTEVPFPRCVGSDDDKWATVIDIDADGHPDIVFLGIPGGPWLARNDGRGRFYEAPGWMHGRWPGNIQRLTVADLDGDGDEDGYGTIEAFPPFVPAGLGTVLFNMHRQVWGLPSAPRGGTYEVEIRARVHTVMAVALSAGRLPTPLSLGALGTWHLDPATTVPLPIVTTDLTGAAALRLTIPNVPFLANRTFYLQALDLADGTRALHATGWWPVRVQ